MRKPMKHITWAICIAIFSSVGCASTVEPIDLHDSNVPLEARHFVADAQDAVSISRARRDDAKVRLKSSQNWRKELMNGEMWPAGSEAVMK